VIRRLIEDELPLKEVNIASAREKSLRHGNISTMHLWWARRPLAMSRAVVFGTLIPDPVTPEQRAALLRAIAEASEFERSTDDRALEPLRQALRDAYPDARPKVLDCFAGGGAIPLEALRLGCDVTALDLNPVAHLIERCCLEFPQLWGQPEGASGSRLADDFLRWSAWLRDRVAPDLEAVFPHAAGQKPPSIYFWCRTMRCSNPACGREIPLVTSRWLANSNRRKAWIEFGIDKSDVTITVLAGDNPPADASIGTIKASSAICPICGTSSTANQMRAYGKSVHFGERLYAVLEVDGSNRTYRVPTADEFTGALIEARKRLAELPELIDGTTAVPDEEMVRSQYRRYGNLVYGIDTFAGMFNTRQLYVLGRLAQGVREAHEAMVGEGLDADFAKAITTYLGFAADRIADYNCGFTSWVPTGEFHAHVFKRQAVAMVWDYVEIDPLQDCSGDWSGATAWIELAIRHCARTSKRSARVIRGDAQTLPFEDGDFDAVIVDPPYYDAIQYGDLSDFFYVWLKRSVGHLYPDLFSTPLTPKSQEVIESRADRKSAEYISHEDFELRLARALCELARVTDPEGVVSIVFAHTDVEAWERLLRALRSAGLVVSTSWPMRSEREARSTAQISAVLGSSVVLVCRKSEGSGDGFYDDVVRQLEARVTNRLGRFEEMGLVGADYFASAVGPAFEVFAQYRRVIRLSGDEVDVSELMVLARQVVARHAMRRLLGEDSISDLDPESLLYLTWRWAYRDAAIPADEAYKLERAFDVDLSKLEGPHGLAARSGVTFALRTPDERKGMDLSGSPTVIDVMHRACLLWDEGRRKELEQLLGETGVGADRAFWSLARALAEVLDEGNRERTMLLGLSGNQDALVNAAAAAVRARPEQQSFSLGG
jgi:adenine-specific DNA methylase